MCLKIREQMAIEVRPSIADVVKPLIAGSNEDASDISGCYFFCHLLD